MKPKRALIVGGGLVGLAAAAMLSDYFESVVIIEKDGQAGSRLPRPGAPQGAHLHVLLKRGQDIVKELFPDVLAAIKKASCPTIDWAADTKWETEKGCFPRQSSKFKTYSLSRPFLERQVFDLVTRKSNISFFKNRVESFKIENNTAVSVQCQDQSMYEAEFIFIAGGQNFPIQRLLPNYGIEKKTSTLPIHITYRSVVFKTDTLNYKDFKQYYYQFSPPQDRLGAVITPVENGNSIATIVEYGRTRSLSNSFEDFLGIAGKIPGGHFAEILEKGQALGPVQVFNKETMYKRRLDQITDFPKNLFILGDSLCSLNPVFGQGMTVALEHILILKKGILKSQLCSRSFHRQANQRNRLPFLLSMVGSSTQDSFTKRYLNLFLQCCQKSPQKHLKFLGILHLLSSILSLFDLKTLYSTLISYGGFHD